MGQMRDVHAVRTPENVVFEFELAGLATRALGWTVDLCVMAALVGLAATISSIFGLVLAGFARALYFVTLFVIQWGYGAVLEWRFHGQTVGKRVVGARVLSSSGLPISFGQAALRNLLRVVDIVPGGYLLGGLCALFDPRGRRFGDIAAEEERTGNRNFSQLGKVLGGCSAQMKPQGGPVLKYIVHDDCVFFISEVAFHSEAIRLIVFHRFINVLINGLECIQFSRFGRPLIKYGNFLIYHFFLLVN